MFKYWKEILLLLFSLVIVTGVTENIFRNLGYKPGRFLIPENLVEQDTLSVLKGMATDDAGIFKVDSATANEISEFIARYKDSSAAFPSLWLYKNYSHETYSLAADYLNIAQGNYRNSFSHLVDSIRLKKSQVALDSAIIRYTSNPVNVDGFRSIEFRRFQGAKPSVLLLGDSYCWGYTTVNITNSFADLLLARGYVVYNGGIGGTDPPQYLAIAKKYVPIIKPDFVIVNFNLDNDVQYFDRKVLPHRPVLWQTNAGYLLSCPDGINFKNPEEAYGLSLQHFYIQPLNWFNRLCAKTVIGTLFWSSLNHVFKFENTSPQMKEYLQRKLAVTASIPYSNQQLKSIREVCNANGSRLIVVTLPSVASNNNKMTGFWFVKDSPGLFPDGDYFVPPVKKEYYNFPDQHFNDKGHEVYARYLSVLIDSIWAAQVKPGTSK